MEQDLSTTISLLSRTPGTLGALLRDLPDAWTRAAEGPGTWTPFDVVGHLLHGERSDWMPRIRTILEFGETRPFQPFDRFAQQQERQLGALDLRPADLARRGRHPSLGPVTLSNLLATWAAHDLTHLHQISRVMATQYRDAVGPWRKFLGVLQCAGHSADS